MIYGLIEIHYYHQCRKGIWQWLFLIFCIGSQTEAYWGEAKRGRLLHRSTFCLGSGWPEAIYSRFCFSSSTPEVIYPSLCFGYPNNRGHKVSKFLIYLKFRWAFGLSFGMNWGHIPSFILGYGKNRCLICCFFKIHFLFYGYSHI